MSSNGKSTRTVRQGEPAARADAALDAVGDRTRRSILARLQEGPCSVVELAGRVDVSRPAVSQHLKVLKEAGLVIDHAQGTRRIYELDAEGLEALQRYTTSLWSAALHRLGQLANDAVADDDAATRISASEGAPS